MKYIGVFIIAVAVFFWFRQSTHFLGDGYQWIALYGEADSWYMRSVKFTELGSSYVIRAIQAILGPYKKATAEMSFQIVAALSGGSVLLSFLAVSRQFFSDGLQRVSFVILVFATPALALFLGYVEFYPFLWAAVSLLILFSVKCLKRNTSVYVVLIIFAVACLIHLSAAFLFPGVLYVVYRRNRDKFTASQRMIVVISLFVGVVLGALLVAFIIRDHIVYRNAFLPFLSGKQIDPAYFVFSLKHILDIINLELLLFPAFIFCLFCGVSYKNIFRDDINTLLLFFALGGLVFLFLVDPVLGMGRDWDLMSFTLLPLNIFLAKSIVSRFTGGWRYGGIYLGIVSLVCALSFVWVNNDSATAEERFVDLLELDYKKSENGWYVLRQYHREKGEYEKAKLAIYRRSQLFPIRRVISQAWELIRAGNYIDARILIERIMANDSLAVDAQLVSGHYNRLIGNRDLAEKRFANALRMAPANVNCYIYYALLLAEKQESVKALDLVKRGLYIHPRDERLNSILGDYYLQQGDYIGADSCGNKLIEIYPCSEFGYRILTIAAAESGDVALARKNYQMYKRFCDNCETHSEMLKQYEYLVD